MPPNVVQHNTNGGTGGGGGNNPTHLYPHRNQQYSTTAVTDQTGAVVERYAYTSYGELTTLDAATLATRTTPPLTRYTYTGRERDPETGSYHFRSRDYLASLARFNSHDPIEYPDGWNTYSGWFGQTGIDPEGTRDWRRPRPSPRYHHLDVHRLRYGGSYVSAPRGFGESYWAGRNGLTRETLDAIFQRGCHGVTSCVLGVNVHSNSAKRSCWSSLPLAKAQQEKMNNNGECCSSRSYDGSSGRARIFAVMYQVYLSGGPSNGDPFPYDAATGAIDVVSTDSAMTIFNTRYDYLALDEQTGNFIGMQDAAGSYVEVPEQSIDSYFGPGGAIGGGAIRSTPYDVDPSLPSFAGSPQFPLYVRGSPGGVRVYFRTMYCVVCGGNNPNERPPGAGIDPRPGSIPHIPPPSTMR